MPEYIWKQANTNDAEKFFALIKKRICWMDEVGIKHWNVLNYTEVYPLEHYIEHAEKGRLWVLTEDDRVLGGAVLYESDDYWADDPCDSAFYIHRFATDTDANGIGRTILDFIYKTAIEHNKTCLRLDCAVDNENLIRYYKSCGYTPSGFCTDGPYSGIRMEKTL